MEILLNYLPYIAILISNIYGFIMAKIHPSKETPLLIHSFLWGSIGVLLSSLVYQRRKSTLFWIMLLLFILLQSVTSYYLFINGYWNQMIES